MIENVEFLDKSLLQISWLATISSVIFSIFCRIKRVGVNINVVVGIAVCAAVVMLGMHIKAASFAEILYLLYRRIFNGTYRRLCLLLFWSICALASIIFCILVNVLCDRTTTIHRKFFHLTVSLVAVSGLLYDPLLLAVCAHLMLQIFILLELLRCLRIWPFAGMLDRWLLIFLDEQDSSKHILTPIFLHLGVFLPVLFSRSLFTSPELWDVKQRHFSGIQCVGVGDSFAAIFGTYFGRTKWKTSYGQKSLEGSLAMLVSQILFMVLILGPSAFNFALILTSLVCTVVEAHLKVCDNVTLPLISASIYYLLE